MIKSYYRLAKPGIIYGNALTAVAGFLLASQGYYNFLLFFGMIVGISLVIGGGCVFNNYIDRDIDIKMERTKHRALATGEISGRSALIFGSVLFVIGAVTLALFTNLLTLGIAIIGFVFYVFVYTYFKRKTVYGTILGSISGAVPPVVGYCSVTGRVDLGAALLFLIMIFWQMPHFFGIAVYRLEDYAAAGIPVLPVEEGVHVTKIHTVLYILGFIGALAALRIFGYAGNAYAVVMIVVSAVWLWLALAGFKRGVNERLWGRKVFLFSLVTITVWSVMISANSLPR